MPSLLEAIDKKYGKTEDETLDLGLPVAIFVPKKSPRNCIPSLLVLNDCDIDSAGDEDQLENKCKAVEELDLAQNRLTKWSEVFCILKQMPRVKFVNLSFNELREELPCVDNNNSFHFLRNLVLNNTHIDWKSVRSLLRLLPSLQELHLSLNEYSQVELQEVSADSSGTSSSQGLEQYPHLKHLHFTGNPVSQWEEISKIGHSFPHLDSLVLADCPLQTLDSNGDSGISDGGGSSEESECESSGKDSPCEHRTQHGTAHACFRHLRFLNLTGTKLGSWTDIDRLSRFPQLSSLRIQGCPLFEEYTEHERRQFLIARLPNVQTLNGGGIISTEEREDSERAFIRYYMDKPEADRPERYNDLLSIHGKLDPLVQIDLSPEKKVKVKVTCGENSEIRSIHVYQTVAELKQRLSDFAGLPPGRMRLFYLDQELSNLTGPEEMRFPNKQLYSYNISSGGDTPHKCEVSADPTEAIQKE